MTVPPGARPGNGRTRSENDTMSLKTAVKRRLSPQQWKILRRVVNGLRSVGRGGNLDRLARIHGTDKAGSHDYVQHYMTHLAPRRMKPIRLLEIGVGGNEDPVGGGGSLRMWKRYFPFGRIYGIDIHDKSFLEERRIRIFRGDQADAGFLRRVVQETGALDVIVDDGSHVSAHVIASFTALFPSLKAGGIYVVEDTQTSYWPEFGGAPPGQSGTPTSMNFFTRLAHGLNHAEFAGPDDEPTYLDLNVTAVHFYHNMVFVYKGSNPVPPGAREARQAAVEACAARRAQV